MSDEDVIDDSDGGKFWRKVKKEPYFPVSIIAFSGIVGYGLYGLKTRKIPMSLYLMQLRVASQGTAIAILALGMCYTMGQRINRMYFQPQETEKQPSSASPLG